MRDSTPGEIAGKNGHSRKAAALSAAVDPQNGVLDYRLGSVINAWPHLPERTRLAVLELVGAVPVPVAGGEDDHAVQDDQPLYI